MQQAVRYILVAIIGTLLLSCVPTASEDFGVPEGEKVSISVPLRSPDEESEPLCHPEALARDLAEHDL